MATPPFDPVTPEPGLPGAPRDSYPRFMPVAPEPDMIPASQWPASQGPVSQAPASQGPGRGGFGGLGSGLVIEGTVESVAADSVTIRTADGTTITVGLDPSTTYHSAAPATASDVTAGTTVKLQVAGGFRPGGNGGGTGNGGGVTLGTAADITIVP